MVEIEINIRILENFSINQDENKLLNNPSEKDRNLLFSCSEIVKSCLGAITSSLFAKLNEKDDFCCWAECLYCELDHFNGC